jgi:hypothetical protein
MPLSERTLRGTPRESQEGFDLCKCDLEPGANLMVKVQRSSTDVEKGYVS